MTGLADYADKLDEYAGHLDDYIKGKPFGWKTVTGIELLMPLVEKKQELTEILMALPITETPVIAETQAIDFDAILESVKRDIDGQYGKYQNPELSSQSAFMVFAHAQCRAVTSTIDSIAEAIQWFGFLKPLGDAAFLQIVGDKPVTCGCTTCKGEDQPICYDGQAPQTLEKCEEIRHVIRKLKVSHEGALVMVNDERALIRDRAALETLEQHGYQIKKGDIWMHRPWTCGEIAYLKVTETQQKPPEPLNI